MAKKRTTNIPKDSPQGIPAEEATAQSSEAPKEAPQAATTIMPSILTTRPKNQHRTAPHPTNRPGLVMGPAAYDPTRSAQTTAVPVSALIYCGLAGIRSPTNAGFSAWAKQNGHEKNSRAEWDKLFAAYKAAPVRS